MKYYVKIARPGQYVKNFFVFAPLFFAGGFLVDGLFQKVLLAFVCFCFAASAIYILNDYCDITEDRAHPIKSKRPLAAGLINPRMALVFMLVLAAAALSIAFIVSDFLLLILVCYITMNILYSLKLKHYPVLDVNIIATGFVLRIMAGAVVAGIEPSVWILLITYLLALFLGFGKRRSDVLLALDGKEVRKNIDGYNLGFIDTILSILAAVIIVCYILYTISPEVTEHYHSNLLYISIIFVTNGMLYYMKLILVNNTAFSPTQVVLKDRVIQAIIGCWIILMSYLLYIR